MSPFAGAVLGDDQCGDGGEEIAWDDDDDDNDDGADYSCSTIVILGVQ